MPHQINRPVVLRLNFKIKQFGRTRGRRLSHAQRVRVPRELYGFLACRAGFQPKLPLQLPPSPSPNSRPRLTYLHLWNEMDFDCKPHKYSLDSGRIIQKKKNFFYKTEHKCLEIKVIKTSKMPSSIYIIISIICIMYIYGTSNDIDIYLFWTKSTISMTYKITKTIIKQCVASSIVKCLIIRLVSVLLNYCQKIEPLRVQK